MRRGLVCLLLAIPTAAFAGGGTSMRLATEPPPVPEDETWLGTTLRLLGGVEVTVVAGGAGVSSRYFDPALEARRDVASGSVFQRGIGVGVFSVPRHTGLVLAPSLGLYTQALSIRDFRQDLPPPKPSDAMEIGAACSDPDTGRPVDCGAPNVYELALLSAQLGLEVGYQVVMASPDLELFVTASARGHAVEYRRLTARIGAAESRGDGFAVFASAAARLSAGFHLPRLHLVLRAFFDYELYSRFRYAEPLEFRGHMHFESDKQVWERPRIDVESAEVRAWKVGGGVAYAF